MSLLSKRKSTQYPLGLRCAGPDHALDALMLRENDTTRTVPIVIAALRAYCRVGVHQFAQISEQRMICYHFAHFVFLWISGVEDSYERGFGIGADRESSEAGS